MDIRHRLNIFFPMKRFKLLSWLLLFALFLVCAVNIYFYQIQTAEAEKQRIRRINNMADLYNEEFHAMGMLVRYLEDNPLVSALRYEQKANSQLTDKYKSLMNTMQLIETSRLRSIKVFVFFHNMDAVVTSNGKMRTNVAWNKFGLGNVIQPEELCQDKSKEIRIYPGAPVYFETSYANRQQSDWGTIYTYTQDYVSIIAIAYNDPLLAAINTAMLTDESAFAVWDQVTGNIILAEDETFLAQKYESSEQVEKALAWSHSGYLSHTLESGRFIYFMLEQAELDGIVSTRFNIFLWVTVGIAFGFVLCYYLLLRHEVFEPLDSILKKLKLDDSVSDEYRAIEEAIFKMQNRITEILDTDMNQKQKIQMQQMLLGVEDSLLPKSESSQRYFALVTILAETKEETFTVCKWMEENFASQKIANMNNQWVLLVWLESSKAYGEFIQTIGRAAEEKHSDTAFAIGISRVYDSLSRIRDAYLESMDVIHGKMEKRDWAFPVYVAGKDKTDCSVSIPMDSNDAGILLSMVSRGDVDTSVHFMEDILDTSEALTIAQCRYRATYLLNVLSMAQNTRREPVFDLTMLTSQIQHMVSTASMRSLVCNACMMVTELFSDIGEDVLIQLIKSYVEAHYAENIYLKTVAEETGLSYAYISHYFSEKQGIGFADYLNSVRIEKACDLLKDWKIPLKEIGESVGFGSMNTFVRNMKKFTGMTPDAYRKCNSSIHE